MLLPLLLACTAPVDDVASPGDDDAADVPDTSYLKGTAALAAPSGGACPSMKETGAVELVSNGVDRKVRVVVPSTGGEGAPVVFVWHPLGATAAQIAIWLDVATWAEATGTVVVVPFAKEGNLFEWDFWNDLDDDLVLYDDLRACLWSELAVDLGRVGSTGMSAGGLWTSFLGIHRGDTLATILPMSGGTGDLMDYDTPGGDWPAMLVYGGANDTWGGSGVEVSFADTTLTFAGQLHADGRRVVLCDHGGGHTLPAEAMDMTATWLLEHSYGAPSPFADGDLSAFPEWCAVYEG